MLKEPELKRVVAFVDGQNLFYAAKECFGYSFPNYEPMALAQEICEQQNWDLLEVRFYTGIPDRKDNPYWNDFWEAKLGAMGHRGINVYSRSLRYRRKTLQLENGVSESILVAEEKGIDVRISLDVVHLAYLKLYDVALIFSQDQDLSEVVDQVQLIADGQSRWIKVASAYPVGSASSNKRGINKTDWIQIDRELYDRCLDPRDYRNQAA